MKFLRFLAYFLVLAFSGFGVLVANTSNATARPYYSFVLNDNGGSGGRVYGTTNRGLLDYGVRWGYEIADGDGFQELTAIANTPTHSNQHLHFSGYNANGIRVINSTGTFVTTNEALTSFNTNNTQLVAYWNANFYKLTLDEAGGSGTVVGSCSGGLLGCVLGEWYGNCYAVTGVLNTSELEVGVCVTRIQQTPTRTGYTFGGFYTGQNGTGTQIIDANGDIVETTYTFFSGPATIYAKWTPNIYTVTLNKNNSTSGSTNGSPTPVYLKYATGWYRNATATTSISQLDTNPVRPGFIFNGYWTTSASTGGTQVINSNGTFLTTDAALTAITSNATVYARWTDAPIYTISLSPNGGTPTNTQYIYVKDGQFYSNSTATNLITSSVFNPVASGGAGITQPSVSGQNFNGYYSNTSGGTQMIDGSGNIVAGNISGAQTWYAQYSSTCANNNIYLSANGGTIPNGCQTTLHPVANSTYSSGFATPAITNASNCIPTKTNYEFLGYWYDGTSTQYYTNTLGIYTTEWGLCSQGDVTLTAHWTGACNLITFDDNNANNTNVNVNNTQRKRTGDTAWLDADSYNSAQCGKPLTTNPTAVVPTNANATFMGYYTTRDTGGTQIFDGTGATTTYANNTWTISTNTTLYARWQCGTGYTWNPTTHACDSDKRYDLYFKCSLGGDFSEQLASLIYGQSFVVEESLLDDLLEKFCPNVCGANASLEGWNVYLNTPGTLSNDSPITNFPHTFTGGVTYGEASPITIVPNCVENPYNSVTYKCYVGDSGQIDNQVTPTNYSVRPLSWYSSCNINQSDFSGWLFSGNNSVYLENAVIPSWTYGDNQNFVPAYDATFSCTASQHWTGSVYQMSTQGLGTTINTPAMTCTPKPEYVGWVNLDGKWHTSYDHNMATPVPGATCNTGAFTVNGNSTFLLGCPTDLLFLPDDELITKTIDVSCGTGGASGEITITYDTQNQVSTLVSQWLAANCDGSCQNPSGAAHGFWKFCGTWANGAVPNVTQIPDEPGCWRAEIPYDLGQIQWKNVTEFNITTVSYCPKYVKYKCSDDATEVYDEPPYSYFDEEYTVLNHTTVGCTDTGFAFTRWKKSDANVYYNAGQVVENWPYDTDVTLVAQWGDAVEYNIIYHYDSTASWGAGNHPNTYSVDDLPLTINGVMTRLHSIFVGWCDDAALTQNCATPRTIATGTTGDVHFYAKWECEEPYHIGPETGLCEACPPNTWWNSVTQSCDGCSAAFPNSTPPFNWSEDQCWRDCQNNAQCQVPPSSIIQDVTGTCTARAFMNSAGTQIEFKGNADAHLTTCDATNVPYCPYGLDCHSETVDMPRSVDAEFWYGTDWSAHGTRYIIGLGHVMPSNQSMVSGAMWSAIVGPAQQITFPTPNDAYTFITYPVQMAPDAEVIGMTFLGYYDQQTGGTQYVDNDYILNSTNAQSAAVVLDNEIPGDRNLYAHYDAIDYTITYSCGTATGGTTPSPQTGIHYGGSVTPRANTCEKPGYNFLGWLVSNTSDMQQPGVGFTWHYTESKIFTAQWDDNPNSYVITYKPNYDGATQPDVTQSVTYGQTFTTKPAGTFTRPGYIMIAWSEPFSGLNQTYTYNVEGNTNLLATWQICPAGQTPNATGTACVPCPEGQYSVNGICMPCPDGTQPNATGDACEPCPEGTAGTGGTCEPCPDGTQPNEAGTACVPCPEGTAGTGGTCEPCPDGTQPNEAGTACVPCPEGTAGTGGICEPCPDGTQPNATGDACEPCPEGEYGLGGVCNPCPAGSQPNAAQTACEPCPDGTYWIDGACEPCPEGYSSNPGAVGIDQCFVSECPDGQHLEHGECQDDVVECTAPHASYATRTWNPAMGAYGSCQIQDCINGYHISSNACVLDEELCTVPNGRGEREWNGTQWGDCVITQCDPGFENTGTACNECANRRVNGEIAVSSYTSGCEIATCMYHGQKYILENNECRPICEDAEDETGTKHWDGTRCVRTCNPGYKMW